MNKDGYSDPKHLATIVRSVGDALVATDKSGGVTLLNPAAERLLGVVAEAAEGQGLESVVTLTDQRTGTLVRLGTPKAFQKDPAPRTFTRCVLTDKEGTRVLVDATLSPLLGYRGKVSGSVLVLRDITDLVVAERSHLEHQKIQAIGDMAGSIARDFINWLGVISAHAASIADSVIPNTRAHDEASRILEASNQASGLTKRLLSVARASRQTDETAMEDLSLERAVADALSLARSTFIDSAVEVAVLDPANMPYVRADPEQLRDCLMSLFRNAVDAMDGKGTITVDTARKTIDDREYAVLRVRDTGHGMAPDIAEQVFDPFFTTKAPGWSLGLGLTMVRSAVQNWGGFIRVRSRPGEGASFRIFIPLAETPAGARGELAGAPSAATILVADDDEHLLADARRTLESVGHTVLTATSAAECLQVYRDNTDDIALSIIDVVMPGEDGKHVLDNIMSADPTAAVIMISGFPRDYVRGYVERGAWRFLQKPFEEDQLIEMVRRLLAKDAGTS